MNYLINEFGDIVGGILTDRIEQAKEAYDYQGDAGLLPASLLTEGQIVEYLNNLDELDGDAAEDLLRELCQRYALDYDAYDEPGDVYDALGALMDCLMVEMYRNYGILGHEKSPIYSLSPSEICDKVTVYIPNRFRPHWTVEGNVSLVLSGDRYLLTDVIQTDRNDAPYLAWHDPPRLRRNPLLTNARREPQDYITRNYQGIARNHQQIARNCEKERNHIMKYYYSKGTHQCRTYDEAAAFGAGDFEECEISRLGIYETEADAVKQLDGKSTIINNYGAYCTVTIYFIEEYDETDGFCSGIVKETELEGSK